MTVDTPVVKKSRKKPEDVGVVGMVLEGVLSAVRGWFETARVSVEKTIADAMIRLARQIFIFFLALLGIAFLLFGLAKTLSFLFQIPGVGEMVVGCIVLVMAFILSFFTREPK